MIDFKEWNSKVAVLPSSGLLASTFIRWPKGPNIPLTWGDLKKKSAKIIILIQAYLMVATTLI